MNRLTLCLFLLIASKALAQPTPEQAAAMKDASHLRKMTMAVMVYIQENGERLPPDLSSLTPYLSGDLSKATPAERDKALRSSFLTAADRGMQIPAKTDEQWLTNNSSYTYLPAAGFNINEISGWDRLAVLHLKLDKALPAEPSPMNPEGRLVTVGFMDCHVEMLPPSQAQAVIAESMAIYEAIKSGKPLPDAHQVLMDLRMIAGAIRAYAKAHNDELPPDLGSVLAYIPTDAKRTPTPKQKAAVFLLPEAKRSTSIPDEPTAEWVNQRTSFVYLGAAGARLSAIEDPRNTLLLHGKLDRPMEYQDRSGPHTGIPLCSAWAGASLENEEYARWIIGVSRLVVEFARSGAPLPEHLNAYRDVRLILTGIDAYCKDHKGQLPPTLGAILPYVLPDASAGERAMVFVSPRNERKVDPPADLTPEWVNAHSTYIYLAKPGVEINLAREAGVQVLVHGPLSEQYTIRIPRAEIDTAILGMTHYYPWLFQASDAERLTQESKEALEALGAGVK